MASTVTLESLKKAVFFPFQGKNWTGKFLIGAALCLGGFLIIPLLFVMGYCAQIMKRVILHDEDPELPEWNDWGVLIVDGLKLYGVCIIYSLPAIILVLGGYGLMMGSNIALSLSSYAFDPSSSDPSLLPAIGGMVGMFGGIAVMMLGTFLGYLTSFILPPALGNMIDKGSFGAAFRVREWWPILRANLGGFVLAFVISMGIFMIVYAALIVLYMTIILCFLLPFVIAILSFLYSLVSYSLFSVAYRDGKHKLAAI
jgi:hypothetical protein